MLRDWRANNKMISANDNYDAALINEAAIQICLSKAPLVTRPSDLYDHARKLLNECWLTEDSGNQANSTFKR